MERVSVEVAYEIWSDSIAMPNDRVRHPDLTREAFLSGYQAALDAIRADNNDFIKAEEDFKKST